MHKPSQKIIKDYTQLEKMIEAHRTLGKKIICTIGSWDMLHIGHMRYLNRAKKEGNILVVGADSDKGIKLYKKSDLRPIIPEDERMEMLAYQDCIDYVTLVDDVNSKGAWKYKLLKVIRPDIFVAVKDSYPDKQVKEIEQYSGKVLLLSRQAEKTSSTKIIEKTVKSHLEIMLNSMSKR